MTTETLASYDELIGVLAALPVLMRETRRRKGQSLREAGEAVGVAATTFMRWERHEAEPCSTDIMRVLRWSAS